MEIGTHPVVYSSTDVLYDRYTHICVCVYVHMHSPSMLYLYSTGNRECARCTKFSVETNA